MRRHRLRRTGGFGDTGSNGEANNDRQERVVVGTHRRPQLGGEAVREDLPAHPQVEVVALLEQRGKFTSTESLGNVVVLNKRVEREAEKLVIVLRA